MDCNCTGLYCNVIMYLYRTSSGKHGHIIYRFKVTCHFMALVPQDVLWRWFCAPLELYYCV